MENKLKWLPLVMVVVGVIGGYYLLQYQMEQQFLINAAVETTNNIQDKAIQALQMGLSEQTQNLVSMADKQDIQISTLTDLLKEQQVLQKESNSTLTDIRIGLAQNTTNVEIMKENLSTLMKR